MQQNPGGGGLSDMGRGGIANRGLAQPQHKPASVVGTGNPSLTMSSVANPGIQDDKGNTDNNRTIVPDVVQQLQENQQRQQQLQQQQQQQQQQQSQQSQP